MRKVISVLVLAVMLLSLASCAGANDVVRLGVMSFANRANGLSNVQVDGIMDVFVRVLANSDSLAVIERDRLGAIAREHNLSMSGVVDPNMAVSVGRLAGCEYVLLGAVTRFNKNTKASGFGGLFAEVRTDVDITIDVRVLDTKTGEVVLSVSETGRASKKASAVSIGGVKQAEDSAGGLEDDAIQDAVTKLGQRVLEATVGEYMQVLSGGSSEITLSVGAVAGAHNGSMYRVYAEGSEVLDMRGRVIGRKTKTIAIVQVTEVQNEFSMARVIKNGGNPSLIRRGDKISPISPSEAQSLIKKKEIATSRPMASSLEGGGDVDSRLSDIAGGQTYEPSAPEPEPDPSYSRSVGASSFGDRPVGLEDSSTNPERVIPTYSLAEGEKRSRITLHKNLQRAGKTRNAYNRYAEMYRTYSGDYLAAYQAGMIAQALGMRSEAAQWFDRALAANPNYVPAQDAKTSLESGRSGGRAPASTRRTKKRR